jgi:hypothetical protein
VLDQLKHQRIWQTSAEVQRVPVLSIHVETRRDVLVTITEFQRALGITFQIHTVRMFIGHCQGEHLAADLVNEYIRAEWGGLLDTG